LQFEDQNFVGKTYFEQTAKLFLFHQSSKFGSRVKKTAKPNSTEKQKSLLKEISFEE
jgi:hypothetical protein